MKTPASRAALTFTGLHVLPEYLDRARRNERLVIARVEKIGGDETARRMGVSDSTVSRLKNGERAQWCGFLAALGLKVVPVEKQCYSPEYMQALRTLARVHINDPSDPTGDDPE